MITTETLAPEVAAEIDAIEDEIAVSSAAKSPPSASAPSAWSTGCTGSASRTSTWCGSRSRPAP
jgi:hypothetical protein